MVKIEEYLKSDDFEMAQLGLEMLRLQEKDTNKIRIILEICLNSKFHILYSEIEDIHISRKGNYPLSSYSFEIMDMANVKENIKYVRSNKTIPSL